MTCRLVAGFRRDEFCDGLELMDPPPAKEKCTFCDGWRVASRSRVVVRDLGKGEGMPEALTIVSFPVRDSEARSNLSEVVASLASAQAGPLGNTGKRIREGETSLGRSNILRVSILIGYLDKFGRPESDWIDPWEV
jgi:hypothetical protein